MPDLKQRLDAVDQIPVDDVWPEIRERLDAAAGRVTRLHAADPRRGAEDGWRKALTIAAVLVLVAAAGILLVRALRPDPTPANPPKPQPAPGVSGALAYEKGGHIYVADPDGSNAVKIAGHSPECGGPSDLMPGWSPDGRYLAFLRGCPDPVEPLRSVIVISYPDLSVVAEFPTRAGFTWSPDSTRIAVWGGPNAQTLNVYGVEGSLQVSLAAPPAGQGAAMMWMPDGSSSVLYGYTGHFKMAVLNVVPLDGSPAAEIPDGLPIASPDGTRIAVVSEASTVVTDADGAPLFEVDRHLDGVVWSPDGDRFASTVGPFGEKQLVIVDAASGEVTELPEARRALLRYRHLQRRIEGSVGFSPDGERILYMGWGSGYTPLAMYSISVDGSDARVLVEGGRDGQWRPV